VSAHLEYMNIVLHNNIYAAAYERLQRLPHMLRITYFDLKKMSPNITNSKPCTLLSQYQMSTAQHSSGICQWHFCTSEYDQL